MPTPYFNKTQHQILIADSRQLTAIADNSVQLVVTSPPYPMIQMWDESFSEQSPEIRLALEQGDGNLAFARMHETLDLVWYTVQRVLCDGGIACINIGDATRTTERFQLYSNHTRITHTFMQLGFDTLPIILWRKPTNAPNKFMGSGMLPPGAYVTLEHEYILLFRKGKKREFMTQEAKHRRNQSSFFWEERNLWFSDIWDVRGVRQKLGQTSATLSGNTDIRERSGAFPFEIAYRLINMFSVYGDTVLDPFAGTGTTGAAAVATGRNSIMVERVSPLHSVMESVLYQAVSQGKDRLNERVRRHLQFVQEQETAKGSLKHTHESYGFSVMTRQEKQMALYTPVRAERSPAAPLFCVEYAPWSREPLQPSATSSLFGL
jgi:DNA modification methylase